MSKDPRVESAIAHWAPRFVSNGILLTDFQEVTQGIDRWRIGLALGVKERSSTKISVKRR